MSGDKSNNYPFLIALALIASFVGVFIFSLAFRPDLIKDVGALWGAWIGAAIGYFFGSRPVDTILHSLIDISEQRRKDLEEEKKKSSEDINEIMIAVQDYEKQLNQAKEEIINLSQRYERAKQDITHIVTTYQDSIDDQGLLDRLRYEYTDKE